MDLQMKRSFKLSNNLFFNKETKEICGYSISNWAKVIGYVILIFCVWLILFCGEMFSAIGIIAHSGISFYSKQDLRGSDPVVTFTIFPSRHLRLSDNKEKYYEISNQLIGYNGSDVRDCYNDTSRIILEKTDISCRFNITLLGPCFNYPYGYDVFNPCFYLRINNGFHWNPNPYNSTSKLPDLMPDYLKEIIHKTDKPKIWTHCEGKDSNDMANMGTLKYHPGQSFETYYFPFMKKESYQSPLIAVQMINPKRNVLIKLTCFLWIQDDYIIDVQHEVFIKT